jgi:hypothetical protein
MISIWKLWNTNNSSITLYDEVWSTLVITTDCEVYRPASLQGTVQFAAGPEQRSNSVPRSVKETERRNRTGSHSSAHVIKKSCE